MNSLPPRAKHGPNVAPICHIGQQSSLLYFVARYLGYEVHRYDNSFEDWSRRLKKSVFSIELLEEPEYLVNVIGIRVIEIWKDAARARLLHAIRNEARQESKGRGKPAEASGSLDLLEPPRFTWRLCRRPAARKLSPG